MNRPWMPIYIGDYLQDTVHLSTVEHGAYLLLIFQYWKDGGLPSEDAKLARYTRLPLKEWMEIRDTIADLFQPGWTHKRIDAELAKVADISGKRRSANEERLRLREARKTPQTGSNPLANAGANAGANADTGEPAKHLQTPTHFTLHTSQDAPHLGAEPKKHDLKGIEFECRKAADLEQSPAAGLLNLAPLLGLIEAGYSLESDILPALRARPNKRAGSWAYFVNQIREAGDTRKKLAADPKPAGKPFVLGEDHWLSLLQSHRKTGFWPQNETIGPAPGEPGCKVPPHLLEVAA